MGTRRLVSLLALVCLALRYPSLLWPLGPDESGYVLVAQHWQPGPDTMYGAYFVDRPPLLIGLYAVAETLDAPYLPRLVAALAAATTVVVAARVGYVLGGSTAARWCAVAAVALVCTPMLGSYQAKGEILGLPLVLTSCWLALEVRGCRRGAPALLLAAAAGAAGMTALGFKQTLYGGLVFGCLLLAGAAITGRCRLREALAAACAGLVGAALPAAALLLWARTNAVEPATMWEALYSFRTEAMSVISSRSMRAVTERVALLAGYFVLSGVGVVLAAYAVRLRAARDHQGHLHLAVIGLALADLVPILLGGAYWSSYLLPMVASTVLMVALLAGRVRPVTVGATALGSACALVVFTIVAVSGMAAPTRHYVGQAIGEASRPGDTVVTVYGAADLVLSTELDAPYPYLWSLPIRVLDPDLDGLHGLLTRPDRPTWVAQPLPINSWKLDDDHKLLAALKAGYRELGKFCDIRVFVQSDVPRELPPVDCDRPFWQTVAGPRR